MGFGRKATEAAKDANVWASWVERAIKISPLVSALAGGSVLKLVAHAPLWAVILGALVAFDAALIALLWTKVGLILGKTSSEDRAEAIAEKQRKRELICKWRSMLAVVSSGINTRNPEGEPEFVPIGRLLHSQPDFLSLKPLLNPKIRGIYPGDASDTDQVDFILEDLLSEIARIETEWGVD